MTSNIVGQTGVTLQVRKRNEDRTLDVVGNRLIENAFKRWSKKAIAQ